MKGTRGSGTPPLFPPPPTRSISQDGKSYPLGAAEPRARERKGVVYATKGAGERGEEIWGQKAARPVKWRAPSLVSAHPHRSQRERKNSLKRDTLRPRGRGGEATEAPPTRPRRPGRRPRPTPALPRHLHPPPPPRSPYLPRRRTRCLDPSAQEGRRRGRGSKPRRPGWGCAAGSPLGRTGPGSRERGRGGRRKWGRGGGGHTRSPLARRPGGAPSGATARTSRAAEKFPARILPPRPAGLLLDRPATASRTLGSARSAPLAAPRPRAQTRCRDTRGLPAHAHTLAAPGQPRHSEHAPAPGHPSPHSHADTRTSREGARRGREAGYRRRRRTPTPRRRSRQVIYRIITSVEPIRELRLHSSK